MDEFKAVAMQQMPMFTYVYSTIMVTFSTRATAGRPTTPMTTPAGLTTGASQTVHLYLPKHQSYAGMRSSPARSHADLLQLEESRMQTSRGMRPYQCTHRAIITLQLPWIAQNLLTLRGGHGGHGWRPRTCLRLTLEAVDRWRVAAATTAVAAASKSDAVFTAAAG